MAVNPNERPIEKERYYHGLLPREEMSDMLKNEGDFLVRMSHPSKNEPLMYIVSVCYNDKTLEESIRNKHLVIRVSSKGKYVMKYAFESMPKLIDYFVKTQEPISENTFLKVPINRQNWELVHDSITLLKLIGDGKYGDISMGYYKSRCGKIFNIAAKQANLDSLSKEQIKDFMAEARVMRAVSQHPNVLWFYGVAAGESPLFLVTELASDGPLDKYLQRNPDLPQSKRDEMCLQAAWGLEYIHMQKYLHRDVQTRNCQYHQGNVKIADFRLTRQGSSYQMDTVHMLPLRWLAPETLKANIYTQKTDVWSYGVFCWEVYNNANQPYPGLTAAEVKVKVPEGYKMSIPGANTQIASMIMTRCWADNQNDRYTMSEVCTNLENITGIMRPNFAVYCIGKLNEQYGYNWGKKDKKKKG